VQDKAEDRVACPIFSAQAEKLKPRVLVAPRTTLAVLKRRKWQSAAKVVRGVRASERDK